LHVFGCIRKVHFLSLTVVLLVIASDVINVTLVITSEECTDGEYNQLWEKLNKTVADLLCKTLVGPNLIMLSTLGNSKVQDR